MKPVLILQHLSNDGPAYLGTWLARADIRCEVRNAEAGEAYPASIEGYAALAVLGGEMSANDTLPHLRQAEGLILDAMARGRPVIGHCLGGQLMARALGARVRRSPEPEIGWQPLQVHDHAEARRWFGAAGRHHVYHWHEEGFEVPAGRPGWPAARPARSRRSRSGRIWRCSSTSRSTRRSCAAGRGWTRRPTATPSAATPACKAARRCVRSCRCACRRTRRWPTASTRGGGAGSRPQLEAARYRIAASSFHIVEGSIAAPQHYVSRQ